MTDLQKKIIEAIKKNSFGPNDYTENPRIEIQTIYKYLSSIEPEDINSAIRSWDGVERVGHHLDGFIEIPKEYFQEK